MDHVKLCSLNYKKFEYDNFGWQAAYNVEYVIEAQNSEDRRDWVATLKYCMRESRAVMEGADR